LMCGGRLIGSPAELGVLTDGGPIKEGVSTRLTLLAVEVVVDESEGG
jgi:hypothetical protein